MSGQKDLALSGKMHHSSPFFNGINPGEGAVDVLVVPVSVVDGKSGIEQNQTRRHLILVDIHVCKIQTKSILCNFMAINCYETTGNYVFFCTNETTDHIWIIMYAGRQE